MDKRRTFLSISGAEGWRSGLLNGFCQEGAFALLEPEKSLFSGLFISASVDSAEKDFEWRRVQVKGAFSAGAVVRCTVHAQNTKFWSEEIPDIDEYIADPYVNRTTKIAAVSEIFACERVCEADFLSDVKGRYIWIKIEVVSTDGSAERLESVRFEYSGDHMTDYLPGIWKSDDPEDFMRRFVSIFNSMALDLEEEVYRLGSRLDYERTDRDMLEYLAGWLDVSPDGLDDAGLRERISRAFEEYRTSQTPEGIKRTVERLTGFRPIIIEHFNVEEHVLAGKDRELYKKLFGENPYRFFILLPESAFKTHAESDEFMKKLSRIVPAHIEAELVLLKEGVYLDSYSYLGVNSDIAGYKPIKTDDGLSLDYNTIIGSDKNEGGRS